MIEYQYFRDPTPHIYLPELLPAEIYKKLVFPQLEYYARGRIGRDLFRGESGYEDLIAQSGWRELYELFTCPQFVMWILGIFAGDLKRLACSIDPANAFYEPFIESRDLVLDVKGAISGRDRNALFARFDIQAADGNYTPYVHLDRVRRLVGGVLFCSDCRDEGLVGGKFALYRDRFFADDRRCLWPKLAKSFPVRHNSGVIFLNSNAAFHGPTRTIALTGLRKWVYFSISSHQPIWSPQKTKPARSLAFSAKSRLLATRRWLTTSTSAQDAFVI